MRHNSPPPVKAFYKNLRKNPFWPIVQKVLEEEGYKLYHPDQTDNGNYRVHIVTSVPGRVPHYTFPQFAHNFRTTLNFRSQFKNFIRHVRDELGLLPPDMTPPSIPSAFPDMGRPPSKIAVMKSSTMMTHIKGAPTTPGIKMDDEPSPDLVVPEPPVPKPAVEEPEAPPPMAVKPPEEPVAPPPQPPKREEIMNPTVPPPPPQRKNLPAVTESVPEPIVDRGPLMVLTVTLHDLDVGPMLDLMRGTIKSYEVKPAKVAPPVGAIPVHKPAAKRRRGRTATTFRDVVSLSDKILLVLKKRPGQVFSTEDIANLIPGYAPNSYESTMYKLKSDPKSGVVWVSAGRFTYKE